MHFVKFSSVALALAAAPHAAAQIDGRATWLWSVSTDNGDAIVEPGESAHISLFMDMSPDANYPDGPVLYFGAVAFDLLGDAGAANGNVVEWQVNPILLSYLPDLTTTDGVSLFNVHALQGLEQFCLDDPIEVLSFGWTPTQAGVYSVEYQSESWDFVNMKLGHAAIWTGTDNLPSMTPWPVREAVIRFDVVPAPPPICLIGILMVVGRHRKS